MPNKAGLGALGARGSRGGGPSPALYFYLPPFPFSPWALPGDCAGACGGRGAARGDGALRGAARGGAECRSSGPRGAGRARPCWAGPGRRAPAADRGAVSGLKSSVQNAPGWVLPRVQQKFSKGSLVKQTLRPSTAPALPRSVMIDIFYSANFYLPCKNVGDKCDKLQICKFL